jgi:hypothetical protein
MEPSLRLGRCSKLLNWPAEAFPGCWRLIGVQCEERKRLNRIYLEAAAKIQESGSRIADMTNAKWKEATSGSRATSKAALEALNRHRKEHGC